MDLLYAILALVSLIFVVWSLISLPFAKGRRGKKLRNAGIGVMGFFGAGLLLVGVDDDKARQAGFLDAADMRLAQKVGITDPKKWADQREAERFKQRQAEAAELEKRNAEKRARELAAAAEATAEAKRQEELKKAEEAKKADEERAKLDVCKADLQCWGEKAAIEDSYDCTRVIERMAKHDYEWTDGMLEPKFSHYRWKDKKAGIVTIIGDKIKMQNGFGAWTHMTYECDVDPAIDALIDVRVSEGRI